MRKDKYTENYQKISNYLKNGECSEEEFKIGLELEHFIVEKSTGRSITYFEKDGVRDILNKIKNKADWDVILEDNNILGLKKNGSTITLEPGAQIEISVKPCKEIMEVDSEYSKVLEDIENAISEEQEIRIFGYHPKSKIKSIPFIPKERYKYMEKYLGKKGELAINMMKGSAATQVSIDFKDEDDFKMKFKVANFLSPIIYGVFDNSPVFEGEKWDRPSLRMHIWNNCDNDRSGIIRESFDSDFGYRKYAQYIMDGKPIITKKGNEYSFIGENITSEVFADHNMEEDEIEHVLSMFFPDVRAKKFIEIRMADALPYPINIAYCGLLKGIFYDKAILNKVHSDSEKFSYEKVEELKGNVLVSGSEAKIFDKSIKEYILEIIQNIKVRAGDSSLYFEELIEFIQKK